MEWASLKPHKSIEYTNTQTHTYMYLICWARHGPENATYWPPCDTSFPKVKDFSLNPNWAQYRLMSPLNMRSRGFWPLIFWGPYLDHGRIIGSENSPIQTCTILFVLLVPVLYVGRPLRPALTTRASGRHLVGPNCVYTITHAQL